MSRKPYPSLRVFQNPILEATTHVHPLTPAVLWLPIIAWLIYRSSAVHGFSVATIVSIGLVGLLFWSLAEYILHRYIFHFKGESKLSQRLHFLIHGLHHDDPNDPTRLVMPPAGSLILGGILFLFFRMILGPAWVEPFFAFFLVGYLCYDYIHYWVHHFRPKSKIGKFLKQHHMMHHFAGSETRWGVSSPLWDYVFGTLEEGKSVRQNG